LTIDPSPAPGRNAIRPGGARFCAVLTALRHAFPRRTAIAIAALACSPLVCALPSGSSVPGGVAIVRIGTAPSDAAPPTAWFGDERVWVTHKKGEWLAIVGIALDLSAGEYTLRVESGGVQRAVHLAVAAKRYPEQRITLKDKRRVDLSPEDEARAEREIAVIGALKRHWRDESETSGDFMLPAQGKLSSRFGLRRFFNGEARAPHSGLDLALARGTPVGAGARGKILATGDYFFNGRTVFIDHGNGLISMYCHLDRVDVNEGERVAAGQRIGLSGMSGRASGPHLHWSVILNGAMVDPILFLKGVGL
jgi:murein DD-endopeptidase MepM/ murein hydrolase activator NlpD